MRHCKNQTGGIDCVDGRQKDEQHHQSPQGQRDVVASPGPCSPTACTGDVVACKSLPNSTHTCVCTHDSLPPFADGSCPRKVVAYGSRGSNVDEKAGIIPVQPLASHENHIPLTSTSKPPTTIGETGSSTAPIDNWNYQVITFSSVGVCGLLMLFIGICLWRKRSKRRDDITPVNLNGDILRPSKYEHNEDYSSCPTTGVPILRRETLSFFKEIGEGCFGKVFKGELRCDDGDQIKIVAIKVLKDSASEEAEADFLREVEIMSAFRHPNILSLLGVVEKDHTVNRMMVFEFMPHGDLAEVLRSQTRSLDDNQVPQLTKSDLLSIALQIGKGMKYLASQRFIHRDLACRNCLVTDGPTVKIADFGMSRDVYTCDYYKIGGSRLLPIRWMARESVLYGHFTLESDIWSYGVVLWEIYSFGKQPYFGHTNEQVVRLILDGIMLIPPEDCPSYICELMKNCWKTEPKHRITFTSICEKLEEVFYFEKQPECFYEKETKTNNNQSLPRPPLQMLDGQEYLLDVQGYLRPVEIREPVTYLETMCD